MKKKEEEEENKIKTWVEVEAVQVVLMFWLVVSIIVSVLTYLRRSKVASLDEEEFDVGAVLTEEDARLSQRREELDQFEQLIGGGQASNVAYPQWLGLYVWVSIDATLIFVH